MFSCLGKVGGIGESLEVEGVEGGGDDAGGIEE